MHILMYVYVFMYTCTHTHREARKQYLNGTLATHSLSSFSSALLLLNREQPIHFPLFLRYIV